MLNYENRKGQPQGISVENIQQAEKSIITIIQKQNYAEEILALEKGNCIKKGSSLRRLDPVMDNGILRVGGRLSRAAMPLESKFPAILPKNEHVSKLIVNDIHKRLGHAGRNHIISKIRQHYWIPCVNALARNIIRSCTTCRRQHASTKDQKMADLPVECNLTTLPLHQLV